jgi:RNA polymerase sigma factor (sigma-70 family)
LKIISIHRNQKLESLITELRKQNRLAQKELFEQNSRKMLSVCRSYVTDLHHAEDCMLKGFVKVFKNIESFKSEGSFEGWIRRIMVNECLDFIKLNKSMVYLDEIETGTDSYDFEEDLSGIDVQELLDQLPETYRAVFNLFVLEEYSHKEIAETLSITESNSKSQLLRAKKKLKDLILQQKNWANEI